MLPAFVILMSTGCVTHLYVLFAIHPFLIDIIEQYGLQSLFVIAFFICHPEVRGI